MRRSSHPGTWPSSSGALGFRAHHLYAVEPSSDGATVTITAHWGGVLGSAMGTLMRGSVRKDLLDELDAIKGTAEAEGA